MRDLTKEEMEEYLAWAKSDCVPIDFNHQGQAIMIGQAMAQNGLFDEMLHMMKDAGLGPRSIMFSAWVTGFMMGRECENRLLTLALKGKLGETRRV